MAEHERRSWDARWTDRGSAPSPGPEAWIVTAVERHAGVRGHAIDIAGGRGRHAVWLARQGWDATLVDISSVALGLAAADARRAGLALTTLRLDLDTDPLPLRTWDLAVIHHYLNRPLLALAPQLLRPGGLLVVGQLTITNLERNPRPSGRYLAQPGETAAMLAGLTVLEAEEGWTPEGRHEARIVARCPHSPARGGMR